MLELGQALVNELGLDPGTDTLSRWMAHYIAELIHSAEISGGENKMAERAACAEAILALWQHRHELPSGKRPFEDWESSMNALKSLGLGDSPPRYFRPQREEVDETSESTQTREWIELADGLDYSARLLIRHCLANAAETAIDKSKKWVKLAENAGLGDDVDLKMIRIITEEEELLCGDSPDDPSRAELESRIEKLKAFVNLADEMLVSMKSSIERTGE